MDQPVPKLSEGDEIMRMAAWRRKRRRTRRGTWNASVITTILTSILLPVLFYEFSAAGANASPERSASDSDFANTAKHLMQTAMKLPPHILPTLNELSAKPKFADTVGFYVPHRGMEDGAGIYLPLPRAAPNKSGSFKATGKREKEESEERSGEDIRDDEVGGGSKYDKSNESGESEEETRSSGKSRVRFKPKYNRRKKRQHGWQGVSIPLFDYLGSKFKDLTTLKRSRGNNSPRSKVGGKRKRMKASEEEEESSAEGRRSNFAQNGGRGRRGQRRNRRNKQRERRRNKWRKHREHGEEENDKDVHQDDGSSAPFSFEQPDMGEFSVVEGNPVPLITPPPLPPTTTTSTTPTPTPVFPAARTRDFMDEFLTDPEPYLRRLAEEEIWRKRQRQRMERLRREQLRKDRRRKRLRHNNQGQGDVKVHVGFRSRPIHHRHRQFGEQPFEMEKPVPLEAEYPSHHPIKKFVVPDEEFLRPWSDTSTTGSSSLNSLGEEDYYYKEETSLDQEIFDNFEGEAEVPFSSYYDYDDEGNIDLRNKREDDSHDETANPISTAAGAIQNMTICLCCSGGDHTAFKKKTLYVQDQKEMDRLLTERSLIERELDCSQHDPIEVVLIFDKSNALGGAGYAESDETAKPQKKKRRRKRPQKSRPPRPPRQSSSPGRAKRPERNKSKKQVNSAEVFYDPTKLKFVFSTPSPLSRKFLEMRDRTAASGEELAIYDMADMPVSTGSAGVRPPSSSDGPTSFQKGEDRMLEVDVGLKNGGIDRAPRFDLDPSPSQRRHLSSNEAEYWEHHSPRSQEAREKQPSFTPTPTFELSSSNGDGLRLRATEPKRRRLTLRPPRPPPFPLNPNLAPAANYLKSRFGPNPFPYPDPEGAPIYFPASSELIEDVILPPPGMKRRGREAKSGEFAIEKNEKNEDTDSERKDVEVINDENDGILDQV